MKPSRSLSFVRSLPCKFSQFPSVRKTTRCVFHPKDSPFCFFNFYHSVAAVLYLNQRIDRENLNAEVLANEINGTTDNGAAVNEAAENGEEVRENPLDIRWWFYLAVVLLWPVSIYLDLGLALWTIHTLIVAAIIPQIFRLWRQQPMPL